MTTAIRKPHRISTL